MSLKINVSKAGVDPSKETSLLESSRKWYDFLISQKGDYTGWVNLPENFDNDLLADILNTAKEIKNKCTLFVVIGIGGSYLGATAVISALNGSCDGYPDVIFAGYTMSGAQLDGVVKRVETEDSCLCVISKSGTTVEPMITYNILCRKLFDKYGSDEGKKRIYAITDKAHGDLRQEADERGYKSFDVPNDIGGRYSVLTSVGLLPIAVCGHDIRSLLRGAKDMCTDFDNGNFIEYALCRGSLRNQGKMIEIFEYFDGNLDYFGEWLKQLFAESEGKQGRGIYPASLCFTRDLHSMGQFLQQGNQIFYETMITVEKDNYHFDIPESMGAPYAGKSLELINGFAEQGVIKAHSAAGIPIITVNVSKLDEYNMGQLVYFFEMSCAISAYNSGVNPFDQPGVDNYKDEMRKLVDEYEK